MGCAASRGVNPIDAALLQALIEAKKKRAHHDLTFNELLLKFPKVSRDAQQLQAEAQKSINRDRGLFNLSLMR